MARKTDGGDEKVHFQSDRFVQKMVSGRYYITREGEERGPFENKNDAKGDLILYMRECHNRECFNNEK